MSSFNSSIHWRIFKRGKFVLNACAATILLAAATSAQAAPVGGEITSGAGAISQLGRETVIEQNSARLDVNWKDFSSNIGERITFQQPGRDALAVNRVVGRVPSQLDGALNANGRVFIINPHGITFGKNARVDVGSLLATTALNGFEADEAISFSGKGEGSVINHGDISVSNGGFAILAAPYIKNSGTISANLGQVELASTNGFTLDLRGDNLITYAVSEEALKKAGVDQQGSVNAGSGQVNITTHFAQSLTDAVVNLDGVVDVSAFAPAGQGGDIIVKSSGTTNFNAGAKLLAKGGSESGDAGFVEVSGQTVAVNGNVDLTAANGKLGTFLIDPVDIVIRNGSGTNRENVFYEEWIEQMALSTHITLEAENSIVMLDLADNELTGGLGDITLRTVGPMAVPENEEDVVRVPGIRFQDKNDTIRTTVGDVTIDAKFGAINIGNIVTGGEFVEAPGEISLRSRDKENGRIIANDLTVRGIDGTGKITLDSKHNVIVNDIEIDVSGQGTQNHEAKAILNIDADTILFNDIRVNADAESVIGYRVTAQFLGIEMPEEEVETASRVEASFDEEEVIELVNQNTLFGYAVLDDNGNPLYGKILSESLEEVKSGKKFRVVTPDETRIKFFTISTAPALPQAAAPEFENNVLGQGKDIKRIAFSEDGETVTAFNNGDELGAINFDIDELFSVSSTAWKSGKAEATAKAVVTGDLIRGDEVDVHSRARVETMEFAEHGFKGNSAFSKAVLNVYGNRNVTLGSVEVTSNIFGEQENFVPDAWEVEVEPEEEIFQVQEVSFDVEPKEKEPQKGWLKNATSETEVEIFSGVKTSKKSLGDPSEEGGNVNLASLSVYSGGQWLGAQNQGHGDSMSLEDTFYNDSYVDLLAHGFINIDGEFSSEANARLLGDRLSSRLSSYSWIFAAAYLHEERPGSGRIIFNGDVLSNAIADNLSGYGTAIADSYADFYADKSMTLFSGLDLGSSASNFGSLDAGNATSYTEAYLTSGSSGEDRRSPNLSNGRILIDGDVNLISSARGNGAASSDFGNIGFFFGEEISSQTYGTFMATGGSVEINGDVTASSDATMNYQGHLAESQICGFGFDRKFGGVFQPTVSADTFLEIITQPTGLKENSPITDITVNGDIFATASAAKTVLTEADSEQNLVNSLFFASNDEQTFNELELFDLQGIGAIASSNVLISSAGNATIDGGVESFADATTQGEYLPFFGKEEKAPQARCEEEGSCEVNAFIEPELPEPEGQTALANSEVNLIAGAELDRPSFGSSFNLTGIGNLTVENNISSIATATSEIPGVMANTTRGHTLLGVSESSEMFLNGGSDPLAKGNELVSQGRETIYNDIGSRQDIPLFGDNVSQLIIIGAATFPNNEGGSTPNPIVPIPPSTQTSENGSGGEGETFTPPNPSDEGEGFIPQPQGDNGFNDDVNVITAFTRRNSPNLQLPFGLINPAAGGNIDSVFCMFVNTADQPQLCQGADQAVF